MVFVYTARLFDFGGGQFKVDGSGLDADSVIVSTAVISPGAPQPLRSIGGSVQ